MNTGRKIVENVIEGWVEMDGDNDLERKLNAFLTSQFLLAHDMPADECLLEARKIIAFVKGERDLFAEVVE